MTSNFSTSHNFLDPSCFYYHPFTREPSRPARSYVWPDGEITQEQIEHHLQFKTQLTALEILNYYYESIRLENHERAITRDIGSVRYLVKTVGLDIALFSIDALINHYLGADNRPKDPPTIIEASNYTSEAHDRLGIVRTIARQHGVDERSFREQPV